MDPHLYENKVLRIEGEDQEVPRFSEWRKVCQCMCIKVAYFPQIKKTFINQWECSCAYPLIIISLYIISFTLGVFSVYFNVEDFIIKISIIGSFGFAFLMWAFSYFSAMCRSPGYLPFYWAVEKRHHYTYEEQMDGVITNEEQFNFACCNSRPERGSLSRQGRRFILRADHVCKWISNWVGFKNYRYFYVQLFWTMVVFLMYFFIIGIAVYTMITKSFGSLLLYQKIVNIAMFAFTLPDLGFFIFFMLIFCRHTKYVCINETTLGEFKKRNLADQHNYYDLGATKNISQTCGSWKYCLLYLLPIPLPREVNGFDWEKNKPMPRSDDDEDYEPVTYEMVKKAYTKDVYLKRENYKKQGYTDSEIDDMMGERRGGKTSRKAKNDTKESPKKGSSPSRRGHTTNESKSPVKKSPEKTKQTKNTNRESMSPANRNKSDAQRGTEKRKEPRGRAVSRGKGEVDTKKANDKRKGPERLKGDSRKTKGHSSETSEPDNKSSSNSSPTTGETALEDRKTKGTGFKPAHGAASGNVRKPVAQRSNAVSKSPGANKPAAQKPNALSKSGNVQVVKTAPPHNDSSDSYGPVSVSETDSTIKSVSVAGRKNISFSTTYSPSPTKSTGPLPGHNNKEIPPKGLQFSQKQRSNASHAPSTAGDAVPGKTRVTGDQLEKVLNSTGQSHNQFLGTPRSEKNEAALFNNTLSSTLNSEYKRRFYKRSRKIPGSRNGGGSNSREQTFEDGAQGNGDTDTGPQRHAAGTSDMNASGTLKRSRQLGVREPPMRTNDPKSKLQRPIPDGSAQLKASKDMSRILSPGKRGPANEISREVPGRYLSQLDKAFNCKTASPIKDQLPGRKQADIGNPNNRSQQIMGRGGIFGTSGVFPRNKPTTGPASHAGGSPLSQKPQPPERGGADASKSLGEVLSGRMGYKRVVPRSENPSYTKMPTPAKGTLPKELIQQGVEDRGNIPRKGPPIQDNRMPKHDDQRYRTHLSNRFNN